MLTLFLKVNSKSFSEKLSELQERAKSSKKGRWADDGQSHVRSITWQIDDPRALIEKYKQQPVDAIVEQIRDGSTVRAFLLPSFDYVTVLFSGIKTPSSNRDRSEEFGEEAKFFVEARLLQRDVKASIFKHCF
jgi:staphylococcal nuclease domain-containing protein 1